MTLRKLEGSPGESAASIAERVAAAQRLDRAFQRLGLSARSLNRILKASRTISDLAGRDRFAA